MMSEGEQKEFLQSLGLYHVDDANYIFEQVLGNQATYIDPNGKEKYLGKDKFTLTDEDETSPKPRELRKNGKRILTFNPKEKKRTAIIMGQVLKEQNARTFKSKRSTLYAAFSLNNCGELLELFEWVLPTNADISFYIDSKAKECMLVENQVKEMVKTAETTENATKKKAQSSPFQSPSNAGKKAPPKTPPFDKDYGSDTDVASPSSQSSPPKGATVEEAVAFYKKKAKKADKRRLMSEKKYKSEKMLRTGIQKDHS